MNPAVLGTWVFDPDRSAYGAQPMPRRGVYELSPGEGGAIDAVARWTDPRGERRVVAFALHPDGVPRPQPDGSAVVARWEGPDLVSEVLRDGVVLHHARRALDGDDLVVTQRLGDDVTRAVYWRARPDVKQVIVYRRDLNMRKGKIAAQVAHASLAVLLDRDEGPRGELRIPLDAAIASWTRSRFKKIVLSVETEDDLVRVHALAKAAGLPTALVTDAGHTEFGGVPTRTTCAVGPADEAAIDAITGPGGQVPTKLP
jgi:PTH2 family peptidyl-tRNA hydrolase